MLRLPGCRPTLTDLVPAGRRTLHSSRADVLLASRQLRGRSLSSLNYEAEIQPRVLPNGSQHAPSSQPQHSQQQPAPAATFAPEVAAAGPPANAEQVLQQMASQQMLLLQQQVTLLTQLLQQSQQQNAVLASQVKQVTQELSSIKKQLMQRPEESTPVGQQQRPDESAPVGQQQPDESTPVGQQQQQAAQGAAETVHHLGAATEGAGQDEVAEIEQGTTQFGADAQQEEEAAASALQVAEVAAAAPQSTPGSPAEVESAAPSMPSSDSDTEGDTDSSADAAGQLLQHLRPRGDPFLRAVRYCITWQQIRSAVETAVLKQQQLEPWQLLAVLRQLSGIMNSSSIDYSTAISSVEAKSQSTASPGDLAAVLLQRLLEHDSLWSPVVPNFSCCLYPHEIKSLILSCAGLPLKLPFGSNKQLQALYEAALQHTPGDITAHQQEQEQSSTMDGSNASSVDTLQLSVDQQLQLLGACLVLGLKPHQQQLQLLAQLDVSVVQQSSLLAAAFLVFMTDALHANRVLANPAAAARVAGALPPDQVAVGEVPVQVFAAALAKVGAAGGRAMNAKLGARRMRQLLLLPLVRLKVHLPLLEKQLQELQSGDAAAAAVDALLPGHVKSVCEAIQAAIAAGLNEQRPQQRGQLQRGKHSQHDQHQQPSSHTRGRGRGRGMRGGLPYSPSARQGASSDDTAAAAPTGGWTVVTAAAALLLMGGQLACIVKPRLLGAIAAATAAQLDSLPDHMLLPLVQLVAASAAPAYDEQQLVVSSNSNDSSSERVRPRGFAAWRSAVLKHLSSCQDRLTLDQLMAVSLELAQHHTAEETNSGSSITDRSSSSSRFLTECDALLATAVQRRLELATSQQQAQQRQADRSYSSQQLAQLLTKLPGSGLKPSSDTATALVKLILLAPQLHQQPASQQPASGPQQVRAPPALAQPADLAVAYTAAGQLPNPPQQEVMQQLAAAVQQATAGTAALASTSSAASSTAPAAAAAAAMTAAEACALVCSLASIEAAASRQNRSQLGDLVYTVYSGIGQLQGHQLAGFVAALARLAVPLGERLGPRALEAKAGVSYGMVVAAAASAAAAPAVLAATPAGAVAQLAASVTALGGRPDDAWWGAVFGRMAAQLAEVDGLQLQQLLQGVLLGGVTPSQAWLDEACQAVLSSSSASAGAAGSLQELREQGTAAASHLITCSLLLVQLGATLPAALQEALITAVDSSLLQQYADGASSTGSALQPAAAANLLASAGCALASSGAQPPTDWLAKYADVVGQLLPLASGDCCCRLTVAVAGLGCQLSSSWIRELQKQLDTKAADASVGNICAAMCSMDQLGSKPSPLLANALVIKTQGKLQAGRALTSSSSSGQAPAARDSLLATDLAAAACALASAGLKLPAAWCSAAIKQIAAVAGDMQPSTLLQTLYAAATWHIHPVPKPLLMAAQDKLSSQQDAGQLLNAGQLSLVATALLSAGQAVPQPLLAFLPADATAAAASRAESGSLSDRANAAKLAEALWEQARTALKDISPMDASILLKAADGLNGQSPAAVAQYLKPQVHRWGQVVQALAQHQQLTQQQDNSNVLNVTAAPDIQQLVQLAAAAVQEVPATARVASGGPATLAALVQLEAKVHPAWIAAVAADLDSQAAGKASWFKQASVVEAIAYLQAAAAAGHPVTANQLEGLAKYMPNKLREASAAQLLQLLELLPRAAGQQPPAGAAPSMQQHAQQRRQQHCTETLLHAVLPVIESAVKAGQLQQQDSKHFIAALVRLRSSILMRPAGVQDSGDDAGGSIKATSKKKPASHISTPQLDVDSILRLLGIAVSSAVEQQADTSSSSSTANIPLLLGCLQLAATVPAAQRPHQLCEQLLLLFVQTVSQAHEPLHPHTAAQLFIPAVALAVTVAPDIARGSSRPASELGGCLVQLLDDIAADWEQLGNAELAGMPRMAAMVHLELSHGADLIRVITKRQQDLAKAQAAVVQEAAAGGGGPVQLLTAAVFQVMNKQPAEPGNSTWEGLKDFVSLQDSSSSVAGIAAAAAGNSADQPLKVPQALFDATNAAVARISSSLSSSDLCDLLHCFIMAGQASGNCTWMSRLGAPDAKFSVKALNHNQQQALLVIFARQLLTQQEPPNPEYVMAVLAASVSSLERWPTAMLPYTLHTLGLLVVRYVGDIPEQLQDMILQWQQAALTALAPRLHMLPAESYVQLLHGCGRIKAALPTDADQPGQDSVRACLQAAALSVAGMLDQLQPLDFIRLLNGLGKLEFAGPALVTELLARLQPHLSTLSAEHLTEAGAVYARWPAASRPEAPPDWAAAFLSAAQQHLAAAMPVSLRSPEQPDATADTPTEGGVHPHLLLQLAGCIPYLSVLPSELWRKQFMLVAVGQIAAFTSSEAAELLYALSQWKTAMAVQLCGKGASDAQAQAGADAAFAHCMPLFDALMFRVAGSGGIAPPGFSAAGGALSMDAVAVLPDALRSLCWPPDEEIVQQMLRYMGDYKATLEASIQKMEQARQRGSDMMEHTAAEAASSDSGSKKQKRKQQAQLTKQQLSKVQQEMEYLEGMISIGEQQLGQLVSLEQNWDELLLQAEELSSRVAALEGSGLPEGAETSASTRRSSAMPRGGEDRLAASSTGLDMDQLMTGMMSAAGMAADDGTAAAAMQHGDEPVRELDAVFSELERLAEAWGPTEEDYPEEGVEYIDTVAEDL